MSTISGQNFIDVFKGALKINTRSLSIKTLLSDRNLRRINYKPYYQRNYVWDLEKQSFFIESVILGTEIPPLILFKSSVGTEVIDGRQRFETLRRFKDSEIILSSKGLLSLQALKKKNFNKLDEYIKDIYLNANIRVFEFEIVTEVSQTIEDKVKKEIFRRYNTGITPLSSEEVDSAKYDEDNLSIKLKEEIKSNEILYNQIKNCFFPNDTDDANLIGKITSYLRKLYILNGFPISRYARSSGRKFIFEILYETKVNDTNIEDTDIEYINFLEQLNRLFCIYNVFKNDLDLVKSKLIYEAIFWALRILSENDIDVDVDTELTKSLMEHYKKNIDIYSEDNSFYYKNILARFQDTANFFSEYFDFNFGIYVKSPNFNNALKELTQSEEQAIDNITQLESLRIRKPNPISKPVDEVLSDVISSKYLIRPSYQRQERISIKKASSIIESILLGVYLPPIFVYKRTEGIKEVIDGQQRLLSIIAFTGNQYRNELDTLVFSKNSSFKLNGLKILTKLNGKNYTSLKGIDQDKILDFDIDEIIIEQSLNPSFEPTDLFIRLNQKPYPIKQNSFEMWNATVEREVIEKIKEVTQNHITWFYFNECLDTENRTDRMGNEELITILSYITYGIKNNIIEKILGLFKRSDRVTCRLKNKTGLTDYINKFEDNVISKNEFISCIEETNQLIIKFGKILSSDLEKNTLTNFFNIKSALRFKRSYQDFYIVWLVLNTIDINNLSLKEKESTEIKDKIHKLLRKLRNTEANVMDTKYFNEFISMLNETCKTSFDKID